MDSDTFETAKENDLSFEEAEQLQEVIAETGLDTEDVLLIAQEL